MAWRDVLPMEERVRFVMEVMEGEESFSELCGAYEISRKTGYKWWNRYRSEGMAAMVERGKAPLSCPHRTGQEMDRLIIGEREAHPSWGPKKLRARLIERYGIEKPPAKSTIGEILKREGMIRVRRRRRRPVRCWPKSHGEAAGPNDIWATDFKGWFRTGDGVRCDPLTISDLYSRYVLECAALADQKQDRARAVFERVFEEYGLPQVIRMDNGSPFGSQGVRGLSKLSVWWLQLGIELEYIEPGHPEQNGSHERMHKTLKEETTRPPKGNRQAQQRRFDEWREEYNNERPHESLGMKKPGDLYRRSECRYAAPAKDFDYPRHWEVRRVRSSGEIKWRNELRFLGEALVGSAVGLEEVRGGACRVYLGNLELGEMSADDSEGLRPAASAPRCHQNKQKV